LKGNGVALGVEESWVFDQNEKTGLTEGQIIFIGTDGIWETKNAQGQMFGKEPIFEILRLKSKDRAEDIMKAVISALDRFRGDVSPEDDVTLMVIKTGRIHPP
jgi:sigma-B regulation protein RsbU (phosphoserine phosphatase)